MNNKRFEVWSKTSAGKRVVICVVSATTLERATRTAQRFAHCTSSDLVEIKESGVLEPCPGCGDAMVYEDETAMGQRCQECQSRLADPPESYEWTVKIRVDPMWVADGLDLTSERMHHIMTTYFDHVYTDEIECETVAAPDPKQIRVEQGYKESGYTPRYRE